jgi:hypothetical protein
VSALLDYRGQQRHPMTREIVGHDQLEDRDARNPRQVPQPYEAPGSGILVGHKDQSVGRRHPQMAFHTGNV